jgi:hypothetical protein
MGRDLLLYRLDEDYYYELPKKFRKDIMGGIFRFYDKEQNLVLTLDGKSVRIRKGYMFNGASFKISIFGLFNIGISDGEIDPKTGKVKLFYPTMVHDAMTTFDSHPQMIYTRKEMDKIFFYMLKEIGWKKSKLYYWAVRFWSIVTFQDV